MAGLKEFTLGPLIAVALGKDKHSALAAKQVLTHLARSANDDLCEQAQVR